MIFIKNNVFAQDSTFIKTIDFPATDIFPMNYFNDFQVKNIFITLDNKFGVQLQGDIVYPPPIQYIYEQSPIIVFDRNGNYENIYWGPYDDQQLIDANYGGIFKNNYNEYYAFDSRSQSIFELNSCFVYQRNKFIHSSDSTQICIRQIYPDSNDFIVIGITYTSPIMTFIGKYDSNFNVIWEHWLSQQVGSVNGFFNPGAKHLMFRGPDNSYYFNFDKQLCVISENGDSLRTVFNTGNFVLYNGNPCFQPIDSCIYFEGTFYGAWQLLDNSYLQTLSDSLLFQDTLFTYPRITINSYDIMYLYKTSRNKLLLYSITDSSDLWMYDENMNLIWEKDITNITSVSSCIPLGRFPIIELENGDFLTCVLNDFNTENQKITLLRIDQNGHALGTNEEIETTPKNSLSCYPNPFNPTINFDIKNISSKDMTLKIFNIKGQFVKTLPVNYNRISWSADNLPSGIYFVRLLDRNKTLQTKKITLIK